ncbi:hypothetical protein [Lewinella sp. LCG006]|uniref:hypothetical protein n=1 Tax=Lewinella sp. LCG006 TaxID=3231911 RepID=UPI0034604A3C
MKRILFVISLILTLFWGFPACDRPVTTERNDFASAEWQAVLDSLSIELDQLENPIEKTTALRNYVGRLLDVGPISDELGKVYDTLQIKERDLPNWYPIFKANQQPTHCSVISQTYVALLRNFGFKAINYSYGLEAPFSHTVVVVALPQADSLLYIVQDPTLATLYTQLSGEPLDIRSLWADIEEGNMEQVGITTDTVATWAVVPPGSLASVLKKDFLQDSCRRLIEKILKDNDGQASLTNLPFLRHYTSWRNPCDNYEDRFVKALQQAGYHGDLRYAMMIKPSFWGEDKNLAQQLEAYFQAVKN